MATTPTSISPEPVDITSDVYYRGLLDQSAAARGRGDHLQAQQLASAAHKWAMDEFVRLQRLQQAKQDLQQVTTQLETAWNKDRSCATLDELAERHPELRRLIARCSEAEERVVVFSTMGPQAGAQMDNPVRPRSWQGPRSTQPPA